MSQFGTFSIRLRRNWETSTFSYLAGVYVVPSQMAHNHAQLALTKGIAAKVMPILELKKRKK